MGTAYRLSTIFAKSSFWVAKFDMRGKSRTSREKSAGYLRGNKVVVSFGGPAQPSQGLPACKADSPVGDSYPPGPKTEVAGYRTAGSEVPPLAPPVSCCNPQCLQKGTRHCCLNACSRATPAPVNAMGRDVHNGKVGVRLAGVPPLLYPLFQLC